MISHTTSFVLVGTTAEPCRIEVDLSPHGLPTMGIVGLPDAAVRESAERVRTAVRNAGFAWPASRLTVNLAPADRRKEGPAYDLPISVAVLAASGLVTPERDGGRRIEGWVMAGELALDGSIRPVRGVVPMAVMARRLGAAGVVVPRSNAPEATLVPGLDVRPVDHLAEVIGFLAGGEHPQPVSAVATALDGEEREGPLVDAVRGQPVARRLAEVAAAGWHNLLLMGPPGCGKSMIARSVSALLPAMPPDAALEVAAIRSAAGLEIRPEAFGRPPFRAPHHSSSPAALVGGGSTPRPGEVSLAHHGVLLLDEFAEFSRAAIDALREPLEDGAVTVSRASGSIRFPSRVLAVATFNPVRGREPWSTVSGCRRLVDRIGMPVLDRFDLHHLMARPDVRALVSGGPAAPRSGRAARRRVEQARARALRRQGRPNGALPADVLQEVVRMSRSVVDRLVESVDELGLSARAFDRIRRVARTIADLEGADEVGSEHVEEAISYRVLDRT